ncbi:uncharacterized protein LOC124370172 [Homalodisca vitripennis]|nr:uncharacterized protein LOC124355232 [Homalodisca vitripennis]XP_046670438.1 uncharacterized protein LOC124360662 [Homalodisca vitripennis]XP_046683931.1 uncharacterized protein LOC124369844 [Homalodisca vitripennis]XP_046684424.1 uncharacterized protein LOC124370172 [Homalodisca vitripennis]
MRVQIFSFTLVPEMVRNYKKTSSRGEWEKTNMDTAFTEVKEGRMTCLGAARTYNVPEATLRRRLKKNVSDMPVHGGRYREVFNEEQLQDLHNYLTVMDQMFFGMTKLQCRKLVFEYAEHLGISHPFNKETKMAGEDWLATFMKKHNFSMRKPEATSVARAMGFNKPSVDKFFSILKEVREKHNFPAANIYNADESGLSTVPNKLPKVISPKGSRRVSKVVSGERGRNVTIICCINATGTYLPPFLVFARKRMRPELMERAPPGSVGHCSDNGWSNGELFVKFLNHFILNAKPTVDSPILLLVDNHRTHITLEAINLCRDNHIVMVGFPPHTTHRLQPLDVSFFGSLKTFYSQACDNFMVNNPGQTISDFKIGELLTIAYFKAATVGNAVSGFRSTGIEPYNPLVFDEHDFAASQTTDQNLDVGLDPSYNEDENPTIQSTTSNTTETPGEPEEETIELSERQETVGLVDCAPIPVKKNTSVFDFKPLPKGKPKDKKRKVQKLSSSIITSTPVKMCLEVKQEMKDEKERLKKKREELRASKVSKKLKFGPYKKRPRCMNTASTSKGSEVRCPGCEEKYSDPPVEEWIQCSKCSEWWHENCTSYEGGEFVCDYC